MRIFFSCSNVLTSILHGPHRVHIKCCPLSLFLLSILNCWYFPLHIQLDYFPEPFTWHQVRFSAITSIFIVIFNKLIVQRSCWFFFILHYLLHKFCFFPFIYSFIFDTLFLNQFLLCISLSVLSFLLSFFKDKTQLIKT